MKVVFIAVLLSSAFISIRGFNPPGCLDSGCERCEPGWTRTGQSQGNYSCQACAPDCDYCDLAGPTKCDFSGPGRCEDGFYKYVSGVCYPCSLPCGTCVDHDTKCTSCLRRFIFVEATNSCLYPEPSWTDYYGGFVLLLIICGIFLGCGVFLHRKYKKSSNEDILLKPENTSLTLA